LSLIVFSHANSFPASTYGVLFKSLRARGFTVRAVERFGHDPRYPVTDNWPHLVQQLHDFAQREVRRAGETAWFVGHSLGGFLSLMCAAQHPGLARGVLLIDSPLLGGWKAQAFGAIKKNPLRDCVAATSVGIIGGTPMLDLCYQEDSQAEVDMNVVMTGAGAFVEVQGTAEQTPFGRDSLATMLALAEQGIGRLIALQRRAVDARGETSFVL